MKNKKKRLAIKLLVMFNTFLAVGLAMLGYNSCKGSNDGPGVGRQECIYGGPDMFQVDEVDDSLSDDSLNEKTAAVLLDQDEAR